MCAMASRSSTSPRTIFSAANSKRTSGYNLHAAQEGRVLILTSSVKLTTHMFENMCMGSSIMSLDHNERSMKRSSGAELQTLPLKAQDRTYCKDGPLSLIPHLPPPKPRLPHFPPCTGTCLYRYMSFSIISTQLSLRAQTWASLPKRPG